jgi:hypothetical protein
VVKIDKMWAQYVAYGMIVHFTGLMTELYGGQYGGDMWPNHRVLCGTLDEAKVGWSNFFFHSAGVESLTSRETNGLTSPH